MPQVVIANALHDGFVVFLTANGTWSGSIADAAVAATPEAADEFLERARDAERANEVIDPYLVEVALDAEIPRPVEYREYIRAFGPSIELPGQDQADTAQRTSKDS